MKVSEEFGGRQEEDRLFYDAFCALADPEISKYPDFTSSVKKIIDIAKRYRGDEVTKQRYIRVLIGDLSKACVALGECHVTAAGSLYATIFSQDYEADCERLSKAGVNWTFDYA